MRKAILCLLLIMLGATGAFAQDAASGTSHPFYIGIGAGADIPGSNWDPNDYLGGGARVFVGLEADQNWAAQVDLQEWFFTGAGNSLDNFRLLAEAKYTFDAKGLQPYLLAGPGIVFQTLSPSGESTANFDALGGLGLQFDLAPRTHFFLEAQANFILSQTTTFTDFPVTAGLRVGL